MPGKNKSWFDLAKEFLGSEAKAGELAKANPRVYALKKGQTINLPQPKNTGWQGGFRVPTGSGDITGQYPQVQQPVRPVSAVQQASFNPRNFVQGAALAPAGGSRATTYAAPQVNTGPGVTMAPTNLPINEDDYIPGKVPGTYVPGLGRVPTPGKLPGVGPKVPSLPGYVPPKKVSPKLPVPTFSPYLVGPTQAPQQAFAPAFIQGAAVGAAVPPVGYAPQQGYGIDPYKFVNLDTFSRMECGWMCPRNPKQKWHPSLGVVAVEDCVLRMAEAAVVGAVHAPHPMEGTVNFLAPGTATTSTLP